MAAGSSITTFGFLARRPRGCPLPLWWLSATRPMIFVEDQLSAERSIPRARWGRPVRIPVSASGATVAVSYVAHNWANANPATFTAFPDDEVQYSATWWPWQRGRLRIQHAGTSEPSH
jgi:hypothetical protein